MCWERAETRGEDDILLKKKNNKNNTSRQPPKNKKNRTSRETLIIPREDSQKHKNQPKSDHYTTKLANKTTQNARK